MNVSIFWKLFPFNPNYNCRVKISPHINLNANSGLMNTWILSKDVVLSLLSETSLLIGRHSAVQLRAWVWMDRQCSDDSKKVNPVGSE